MADLPGTKYTARVTIRVDTPEQKVKADRYSSETVVPREHYEIIDVSVTGNSKEEVVCKAQSILQLERIPVDLPEVPRSEEAS